MSRRYTNWSVRGYQRDRYDSEGIYLGKEEVVVISEPRTWTWEVVLDRERTRVTDFRMIGHEAAVDTTALTHVPVADLVRIARAFLDLADERYEDEGWSPDMAMHLSELAPGTVSLEGRPTDEELARAWHDIGPRTPEGVPRRQALAQSFRVAPSTIDVWIRRVRDNRPDLIGPATVGRGNRTRPALPDTE